MTDDPPSVLIVEDDDPLRETYAGILSESYDVDAAATGGAAIERVGDDTDIVLLDRGLSEMRGRDVLREIQVQNVDCYIALVTATEPGFDIIELGIDDYLVKPVSSADLERTVDRLQSLAAYDETYRDLSQKRVKRNILSAEKSDAELADSREFVELEADIEQLEAELEDIEATIGDIGRELEQ